MTDNQVMAALNALERAARRLPGVSMALSEQFDDLRAAIAPFPTAEPVAGYLVDGEWTDAETFARIKYPEAHRITPPAPALDGVREAQSKIWQAMGLAVIRDAIREADPNNHETWTRISPQEAKYVRDGLFAAHQVVVALSSPSEVRKALEASRDLIACIKQRSSDNLWWVDATDPETAVCDAHTAVEKALSRDEEDPPCPICGNEVRGQGGYLQCECPATPSVPAQQGEG